jgi:translation initiation factor IF-3
LASYEEVRVISRDLRTNEQIRAREVRLVGQEGEQLGVVQLRDALRAAAEAGVDLVEVAPTAKPPVCRLMDYGRFKYEQAKRDRDARKKQRTGDIKEVKMRPNIDDHDFGFKSRNAHKFLKEGNKVKVTIMFRGREIVHQDIARALVARFSEAIADVGVVERLPKLEGRNMVMIVMPRAEVRAEARAEARAGTTRPAAAPAAEPTPAAAPAPAKEEAPAAQPEPETEQ